MNKNTLRALAGSLCALLMISCVGIDTKVKISADGSGSVTAEYRLSEELVAFGELEGNKDMLPVPLTQKEVEESLKSAKGLKLTSWNKSREGSNYLIKTIITFDSLDSFVFYLDPKGRLARHEATQNGHEIFFSVGDSVPALAPDMKAIAMEAFAPYSFNFSFDLPSAPKSAESGHPAINSRIEGNSAFFSGKMKDIVSVEPAPSMRLSW